MRLLLIRECLIADTKYILGLFYNEGKLTSQ
jgi:hypothetical protein